MAGQKKTQQINKPLEYGCVKVLRGKDQIGGSVVQITSANGTRIWVDFGSELSVPASKSTDSELVKLMHDENTRPSAVFFTHIHGDHIGLLSEIEDDVDIYIGELGKKMKDNVIDALTKPSWREETEKEKIQREKLQREQYLLNRGEPKTCFYKNGEPQEYKDIEFAALRVDHSVFDSYMLKFKVKVKENDKETTKVILHTGDFRGHGRLGENLIENLEQFINDQAIDILITEGTMMSRATEKVLTEVDMQAKATEILEKDENKYAFLICSSTNLDSLSSFYRAAVNINNKRALYCSEYIKSQLELFTTEIGEKENRWEYKFYRSYEFDKQLKLELKNGQKQEEYMRDNGFLLIVNQYDNKIMEHFRDLNPLLIYSMWDGYLDAKKPYANKNLIEMVDKWKPRVEKLHTSGHATTSLIAEVIKTVAPQEAIIPIHTEQAGRFYGLEIDDMHKKKLVTDIDFNFCKENDCRAFVLPDESKGIKGKYPEMLKALKEGGCLHAFVELVQKKQQELQLCFRANSGKTCTIYYNNHEFFKISIVNNQPRLSMNMSHARYYEKSFSEIKQLFDEVLTAGEFRWKQKVVDNKMVDAGEMVCDNHVFSYDELLNVYELRKAILDSYFDLSLLKDQYNSSREVSPSTKLHQEKKEQQLLMKANANCKNGYYIYDMEFAQPFVDKKHRDDYSNIMQGSNKPDSLAIKFKDGVPEKMVFIELKSTAAAMEGASGAIEHMNGMRTYVNNAIVEKSLLNIAFNKPFLDNRKKEAYEIMKNYQELGLHDCTTKLNLDDFINLKTEDIELLLVLTNNVPKGILDKDGNEVQSAYSYYKNCSDDVKNKIKKASNDTKCKILLLDNGDFNLLNAIELS